MCPGFRANRIGELADWHAIRETAAGLPAGLPAGLQPDGARPWGRLGGAVSLEQLDAFLEHARRQPELDGRLHDRQEPLELDAFLALARGAGFEVQYSSC